MRININPYYVGEKEKQGELYNNEIQRVKELSANIKREEEEKMRAVIACTTIQMLGYLNRDGRKEELSFVSVSEGRKFKAGIIGDSVVILTECAEGEYCPSTVVPMDVMWEKQDKPKVKKVVTFIEAVEAFNKGIDIYCMYDGVRVDYKSIMMPGRGEHMLDVLGMAMTTGEILNGEWFLNE